MPNKKAKKDINGQTAKNKKESLLKLLSHLKVYLPAMIVALLLSMAGTIFNIIGPSKLNEVTDIITAGIGSTIDLPAIYKIALLLGTLYVIGLLFNYIQQFVMATVTQKVSNNLRDGISKKINRLPLRYFDTHSFGDVLSRVTNDVDTIAQTLNQSVASFVSSITMFIGALMMMFSKNVILTLAAIITTSLGFIIVRVIMSKSQKYFYAVQQELGEINGQIEEVYSAQSIVKLFNGEQAVKKPFDETNQRLYNSAWKSQFFSGLMMPLMGFIGNLSYVIVCVLGSVLVIQGQISFGVVVAFIMYVRMFTQPLNQIAQALNNLQSTAAASERVFEFLAQEELEDESHKTKALTNIKGDVSFENVKFGYDSDKIIIKDFSVDVKSGQKIAIVGPTGAGKTTMVNLLMRFYELNSGQIKIDGIPINEVTRENVHSLFCMVLQDTWLFNGTIKENITYNTENVSDDDIINACKSVGLHHFIKTLPHGYNTVLDDNTSLSAGQKQLMTIARGMIQNAPMLILDEATSSVDTRTEILIQRAMDKLMQGRTSFIIAHRLSTIKNADIILVMKDGDIIESGDHETLMAKNGFYSELYNSQFEESA